MFWPPGGHGSSSGKAFCNNCFWRRPVPGKTSMLIDFTSCFTESSSGLKPNLDVQVSTSSDIAGMINFSTLRDVRIWNGKMKENNNNHQKRSIKQDIKLNLQLLWLSSIRCIDRLNMLLIACPLFFWKYKYSTMGSTGQGAHLYRSTRIAHVRTLKRHTLRELSLKN